jgi:hypothetical protein
MTNSRMVCLPGIRFLFVVWPARNIRHKRSRSRLFDLRNAARICHTGTPSPRSRSITASPTDLSQRPRLGLSLSDVYFSAATSMFLARSRSRSRRCDLGAAAISVQRAQTPFRARVVAGGLFRALPEAILRGPGGRAGDHDKHRRRHCSSRDQNLRHVSAPSKFHTCTIVAPMALQTSRQIFKIVLPAVGTFAGRSPLGLRHVRWQLKGTSTLLPRAPARR